MNPDVPKKLSSDIEDFVSTLKTDIGDDLVSAVLYGGLLKNDQI